VKEEGRHFHSWAGKVLAIQDGLVEGPIPRLAIVVRWEAWGIGGIHPRSTGGKALDGGLPYRREKYQELRPAPRKDLQYLGIVLCLHS